MKLKEGSNSMKNLLLLRVDDRLIHGQVMTAWLKTLPAKQILVVDNGVAADDFMSAVIEMAAPDKVDVKIYNEDQAAKLFKDGLEEPSIVLVKTPITVKRLVKQGIEFPELNIGGVGMAPGKKKFYKNISLSAEERSSLKEFIEKTMKVFIQIIPSEKSIDVGNLLK